MRDWLISGFPLSSKLKSHNFFNPFNPFNLFNFFNFFNLLTA